jgi:hypothetical protein
MYHGSFAGRAGTAARSPRSPTNAADQLGSWFRHAALAPACSFCATGRMGLRRNLKAWEIGEQVRVIGGEAPRRRGRAARRLLGLWAGAFLTWGRAGAADRARSFR